MTDQEVNKIIAEFMGFATGKSDCGNYMAEVVGRIKYNCKYTFSLDALVPVWTKLKISDLHLRNVTATIAFDMPYSMSQIKYTHKGITMDMTIQKAAAYATAKAILELEKEK